MSISLSRSCDYCIKQRVRLHARSITHELRQCIVYRPSAAWFPCVRNILSARDTTKPGLSILHTYRNKIGTWEDLSVWNSLPFDLQCWANLNWTLFTFTVIFIEIFKNMLLDFTIVNKNDVIYRIGVLWIIFIEWIRKLFCHRQWKYIL